MKLSCCAARTYIYINEMSVVLCVNIWLNIGDTVSICVRGAVGLRVVTYGGSSEDTTRVIMWMWIDVLLNSLLSC